MIKIIKETERRAKCFVANKIETYKTILLNAQNRLVIGIIMVGLEGGLIVSAYVRAPQV